VDQTFDTSLKSKMMGKDLLVVSKEPMTKDEAYNAGLIASVDDAESDAGYHVVYEDGYEGWQPELPPERGAEL
jgi:hypothetical protein